MLHGTGDPLSRRDWLAVMGAAGAGAVLPPGFTHPARPGRAEPVPILPLTSTSEVFTPSHGRAFMRLSFAFPEPSVEFEGYRFGFLVFTRENVYGLDAGRMTAARTPSGLEIRATRLVRSEEHTSELQSLRHLVCRLLLEKKKKTKQQ